MQSALPHVPVEELESIFAMEPAYGSSSEAERLGMFRNRCLLHAVQRPGLTDNTGFYCSTLEGSIIGLIAMLAEPTTSSRQERCYWQPVAAHLAAAWRLRQRLASGITAEDLAEVELRPNGDICHAAGSPPRAVCERLRELVRRRELAHTATGDLWPELIDGRWTLVDRYEASGRRVVLALRNAPSAAGLCRLSQREIQALDLARRGASNKEIGLTLNLSAPSVTRLLQSVTHKLRGTLADVLLCSRAERVHCRTLLAGRSHLLDISVDEAASWQMDLSVAERRVVAAALRGRSNRDIATLRGTSVRTVANQLASAFEKLGVHSRRELASRIGGFGAS